MILHTFLAAVLASADATAVPPATSVDLPPLPLETMAPLVAPSPRPPILGGSTFSWTYAEVNYLWRDSNAADKTLDGVEFRGSFEIMLNFFLQASYARLSSGIDLDEYGVGLGYHFPIGSTFDLYGTASYAKEDFSGGGPDDDGALLAAGTRWRMLEKLELNGELEWANVHTSAGGVQVGARWYLMDMLSLGASYRHLDKDDSFAVGARVQF
jgi:hypothetical protein